jgi:Putative prokaryotic signal transducing protein
MSDSPYELQRLVTVRTFSTPWEAQIAQARLGSEGLHSLIANEHVIRMVALSNAVGGIQLKVREQDVEAAAAVLERLAPLPEIYLVGQDAAAAGAPSVPASPPADVPVASPSGVAALQPAGVPALPPAGAPPGDIASPSCPSCGGLDLRPERSARLVLGVLPISRRAYRCGDCGSLWRLEEIGGTPRLEDGFLGAGAAAPGPGGHGGQGGQDDDTALSTVARFHTPWEAHLARSFLESGGWRCCVLEERLPAVHLLSSELVAYNRLEVRRADAARAAEILARAWSYPSLVAIPDPDAGGLDAAGSDHAAAGADPGEDPDVDRDPGDPAAKR